jgi:hypothetical protein
MWLGLGLLFTNVLVLAQGVEADECQTDGTYDFV